MPEGNGWKHRYHAEASALEGHLKLPIRQPIERQAHAKIRETGGYESQHGKSFRVEGIISYTAAHTQVSGHEEEKHGRPRVTLATAVVENLNVLNVVTADRIVAQVSTEHPRDGYVPTVTFLGTQFENLRIAGHRIEVDLEIDLGSDPPKDIAYTRHPGFIERVASRLGIVRAHADLPDEIKNRYAQDRVEFDQGECSEFSLVKKIEGSFPGKAYGHVLDIPHFGKVYLAVVRIEQSDPDKKNDIHKQTLIDLTMMDIRMGCIANGAAQVAKTKTNGASVPGGG
jgi:hypothetical protein